MSRLKPFLEKEDIDQEIDRIARKISEDYTDRPLVLVGVLKGAFVFLADLARKISIPLKVDFVGVSSYGSGTESSGKINLTKPVDIDLTGKDVLLVEDIVDSGLTIVYLIDYLQSFNPNSVKICALLDKRERREVDLSVDYACHVVEKGFLVGYGLDFDEQYRQLPAIYDLELT